MSAASWVFLAVVMLPFLGILALVLRQMVINHRNMKIPPHADPAPWAEEHGWDYLPQGFSPAPGWRAAPFRPSMSRKVLEALAGNYRERRAMVMALRVPISYEPLIMTTLRLPRALPPVEITLEDVVHRAFKPLGAEELDVESEDFNRTWFVSSDSPRLAHAICSPRFIALMNEGPREPVVIEGSLIRTWHVAKVNPYRAFFRPIDTTEIFGRLERLTALIDAIPGHVWDDFGYDPGSISDKKSGEGEAGPRG